MPKSDLDREMFKTSGMQRAAKRDSMGKQFGIGNFFAWAMEKYPRLTLGQLEDKMPSLEREYNQEKTMRKERPDEIPTVSPFSDDEKEVKKAKGIKEPEAFEGLNRIKQLAGLPITEDEGSVTKVAVGHVDDESDMMRKELYKIGKYSVELYKMLGELPDGDFPHWWQGKVIKAGEYISSAKHYLEGEMYAPEEESPLDREPEDKDEINPSGV
jgi:hypothetical protein